MTVHDVLRVADTLTHRPEIGLIDLQAATHVVVLATWIRTLYPSRVAMTS